MQRTALLISCLLAATAAAGEPLAAPEAAEPRPFTGHAPPAAVAQTAPVARAGQQPRAFSLLRPRIEAAGLVARPGRLGLVHSPAAEEAADRLHARFQAAGEGFGAALGWEGELLLAVLDAGDYARLVDLPWPTPFAEVFTGLIVMPADISGFPGFDTWDIPAGLLSEGLLLHEMGHAISFQLGRQPRLLWLDELVANAFLAAHARTEMPQLAPLLAGRPPRFADPGPLTRLIELETVYFAMGARNYSVFQFELARLADLAVAARPLPDLLEGLAAAGFAMTGATEPEPLAIEAQLVRLETVVPGIVAAMGPLGDVEGIPVVTPGPCPDSPGQVPGTLAVFLENATAEALDYATDGAAMAGLLIEGALPEDAAEAEAAIAAALAARRFTFSLAPGARQRLVDPAPVYLPDGRCLVPRALPSQRLLWPG